LNAIQPKEADVPSREGNSAGQLLRPQEGNRTTGDPNQLVTNRHQAVDLVTNRYKQRNLATDRRHTVEKPPGIDVSQGSEDILEIHQGIHLLRQKEIEKMITQVPKASIHIFDLSSLVFM